jgi:hypothetical protein
MVQIMCGKIAEVTVKPEKGDGLWMLTASIYSLWPPLSPEGLLSDRATSGKTLASAAR